MKGRHLRLIIIFHDLLIVALSWMASYFFRYEFELTAGAQSSMLKTLPIVILVQAPVFWKFGLYKGVWRFASMNDLMNIMRSVVTGALIVSIILFILYRLEGVPRSSLLLYPLFLGMLLGAPRMLYRMWKDHTFQVLNTRDKSRVLIIGAGNAGEALLRDIMREGIYEVVGFLDDSERLHGSKLHGVTVLGPVDKLSEYTNEYEVDLIILAVPSAKPARLREMIDICEKSGINFRTLPRVHDLVNGKVSVQELREVLIEDLLGREPVSLDWKQIYENLTGKVVLITGGGGSIGSELCRQIASIGPARLVLLERNEFNLYSIEMELQKKYPGLNMHACLGDICDDATVDYIFNKYRPEIVFHAAAYKHVPLLEEQIREAAFNNIIGTCNIANAADRHNVKTFVLISTDKAVNPTNIMGTCKRVAEIYCQNLDARSITHFITVRFGNVLDSAGSVVPLFRQQIAAGGPVTVTHPEITRYFMTISEASQLILQAAAMGNGGEIFVLDMGEPVQIAYLAEQMILLSGKEPGKDIDIVYTGLRPGEKLYEELFHENETLSGTSHDKILLASHRSVDWGRMNDILKGIAESVGQYDENRIKSLIHELVPEKNSTELNDNIIEFNKNK
jgi:FlaA1/EpsC-like NDP-sugar epimerase